MNSCLKSFCYTYAGETIINICLPSVLGAASTLHKPSKSSINLFKISFPISLAAPLHPKHGIPSGSFSESARYLHPQATTAYHRRNRSYQQVYFLLPIGNSWSARSARRHKPLCVKDRTKNRNHSIRIFLRKTECEHKCWVFPS